MTRPGLWKFRNTFAGVAAQAASSASNMLLTFGIAVRVDRTSFGTIMFAYLTLTIARGVASAAFIEPLIINKDARRGLTAGTNSAVIAFGIAWGLCIALAGLWSGTGWAWFSFGIALPAVLSQDLARTSLLDSSTPGPAVLSELLWVALAATALAITESAQLVLGAWVGGAWIAAAICWTFGYDDRIASPSVWRRTLLSRGKRFVAEFVAQRGTSQFVVWTIRSLVSAAEFGALRGAQALFGPVNTATVGGMPLALIAARRRSSAAAVLRVASLFVALLTVLCTTPLLVLAIPSIGDRLLGPSFVGVAALMIPLAIQRVGTSAVAGALVALRIWEKDRETTRARLLSSFATLACGLFGALVDGIEGAAWGFAAAGLIGAAVWWRTALQTFTELR